MDHEHSDELNQILGTAPPFTRRVTLWRDLLPTGERAPAEGTLLYGRRHQSDREHHLQLISREPEPGLQPLARLGAPADGLLGIQPGDPPEALDPDGPVELSLLDPAAYGARNRGLLLARELPQRSAALVGFGSVGSRMGPELARLGVTLHLLDPDLLEEQNPIRWGLPASFRRDTGRPKVEVAAEMLRDAFPVARVTPHRRDVVVEAHWFHQFLEQEQPDLVVVSTDTRDSCLLVNDLCVACRLPALFVALSDAAASVRLEVVDLAREPGCHRCSSAAEGLSAGGFDPRRATHLTYGVDTADTGSAAVPALSADINLGSAVATKLALAILAGEDWRRTTRNGAQHGRVLFFSHEPDCWIFSEALQKVSYQPEPDPTCPTCGEPKLDQIDPPPPSPNQ